MCSVCILSVARCILLLQLPGQRYQTLPCSARCCTRRLLTGSVLLLQLIWMYDHSSANITRIFTTPYGAETTGTYWYPNYGNGKHSYMTAVVQHPYGESDQEKVTDTASSGSSGWIGYFGPIVPVKVASSATSLSAIASITFCVAMVATLLQ